ncbi:MAG: FtsX-like permease family protein [Oscillospiraceae bacterium]|nr:FtsX-like permease family protein [Oscillospiraceae bacterium]
MFEGTLARKYISAQKRHSALTICSIAIALALIATLFSLFSTGMSILRNIAYDDGDYHIMIWGVDYGGLTQEQYNAVEKAVGEYGTCTRVGDMITGHAVFNAKIMLEKDIDNAKNFVGKIERKMGLDQNERLGYTVNSTLMELDMRDDQSKLYMLSTIAVFYVFVLFFIMMLRLIIDTAFEVSSKERERQFGVLQSIGATPKQIVKIITCEGLLLSVIGIPLGTAAGVGLGYLVYRAVLGTGLFNLRLSPSKAAELVHFSVNPWLLLLGVVTGLVWVLLSAYGTGMRIIKKSPVEAISGRANEVKRVSRSPMLGRLFGWTGKLASRNNKRQPKRFAAAIVALTLSIADFSATMVVVSDIRGAADKYYEEYGISEDFRYYFFNGADADTVALNDENLRKIEESGLFEAPMLLIDISGVSPKDENKWRPSFLVRFLNEAAYEENYYGEPPISYDELAKSGKYIFGEKVLEYADDNVFSLVFEDEEMIKVSEEEYNALSPEEQEKFTSRYTIQGVTTYGYYPEYIASFEIDPDFVTDKYPYTLVAAYETYLNGEFAKFRERSHSDGGFCSLINPDDLDKAIEFFEENSIIYEDETAERRQLLATISSVNIVAIFLIVLIALIAVVNMVNVLVTGILNRRAELAALQCVGMTEKDLRKMTLIECLQYALTSGIAAVFVCEALMLLTKFMLTTLTDLVEFEFLNSAISFVQPLPIIFIASICAFIIAVTASIIALKSTRKMTLVEQIRAN